MTVDVPNLVEKIERDANTYDGISLDQDEIDLITLALASLDVCPFDCDSCHGGGCPCERLGCDGE